MDLTISVDARTLDRARTFARQRGVDLQVLVLRYIESLADTEHADDIADSLIALFKEQPGRSRGRRIVRDGAYDDHG